MMSYRFNIHMTALFINCLWFQFTFLLRSWELTDIFHQILYVHLYRQDLAWDCNTSFFGNLYKSYGPWFTPKFRFRSISREPIGSISPNFIYAFILAKFSLGLLQVIFHTFEPELWPLIYVKISFPLNILRTNWQNFTKLYICIHFDKIYVGIVTHRFSHIFIRVMALDLLKNFADSTIPWEQIAQILATICTDNIYVWNVRCRFLQIC